MMTGFLVVSLRGDRKFTLKIYSKNRDRELAPTGRAQAKGLYYNSLRLVLMRSGNSILYSPIYSSRRFK